MVDYFILYTMFRAYKKDDGHSYALGAFPTVELIKCRGSDVRAVILHSKFTMPDDVADVLKTLPPEVPVIADNRAIERIANKGNVFMIGVFGKYECPITAESQLVLYQPSDAGNLGTVIRTAVGFGVKNIVLIGDAADVFDPKTVRASMGAVFRVGIKRCRTLEQYAAEYDLPKYLFMLGAKDNVADITPPNVPCALVFGNEASGLPAHAADYGTPVVIKHSDEIDSLALPQAVAIGLYHFNNLTKGKHI